MRCRQHDAGNTVGAASRAAQDALRESLSLQQARFYCGVDLQAKRMRLCVLDHQGNKPLHRNMPARPRDFLNALQAFQDNLVVGVACMFAWYWLADLCLHEGVSFTARRWSAPGASLLAWPDKFFLSQ